MAENLSELAGRLKPYISAQVSGMAPAVDHGLLNGLADDDHAQYLNVTRHDTTARHGSGVVDHGLVGGLADDDHTQYLNTTRHDTTARHGSGVVDHGLIGGLADDDHSQYVHISTARTITAAHTFNPGVAGAPFVLGANAQGQTVTGLKADTLNKSVSTGTGLSGGGALTSSLTLSVDQSFSPTWTGTHQFNLTMNASSIMPRATDTYDLGSATKLWRKGWLSELDAVLFAKNTISLLGGWFWVTKNAGVFAADVASGATSIDFGTAMTVGDFVACKAALKVEYFQVGSLVSGTTYNVTRNLDGSGANDWPAGTPFAVLGSSGNGRIELNAYDTPRISVLKQGATYNAQTEMIRLGDINGLGGATTETYGVFIGGASSYLKYDGAVLTMYGAGSTLTREEFFSGTVDEVLTRWSQVSGTTSLSINTGSPSSGGILRIGDNSGNDEGRMMSQQSIPFDPEKLYRLYIRVRQVAGSGTFFAGVAGRNADDTQYVNATGANSIGSQYYLLAAGVSQTAVGEGGAWTEYVAYFKGTAATGSTTAKPNASAPGVLHSNTRFFRFYIIPNFSTQAGIVEVDEMRVDIVPQAYDSVWAHGSDKTQIDGGNIYTGTVTAAKISVANLQALSANMGALTVDNTLTISGSGKLLAGTAGAARTEISTSGLAGYNASNVLQVQLAASTGVLTAASGKITLGSDGLIVTMPADSYDATAAVSFKYGASILGALKSYYHSGSASPTVKLSSNLASASGAPILYLEAYNSTNGNIATMQLVGGGDSYINIHPTKRLYVEGAAGNDCILSIVGDLEISKTTKVTNLNADLLDGLHQGSTNGTIPKFEQATWSPTFTGFSANPTGEYRYTRVGKMCTVYVAQWTNGTSNANTFRITAPFTAATAGNAGFAWVGDCQIVDNGVVQTTPGKVYILSGGTEFRLFKDYNDAVWTTSGGKRAYFILTYETT